MGRQRIIRWIRALAFVSHDNSCELKSSGELKLRPAR
jgi:hypothetical protein